MYPETVKHKHLTAEEREIKYQIKMLCEGDEDILDIAKTSHLPYKMYDEIQSYPRFHRGESYLLPFTDYKIFKYNNCSLITAYPRANGWGQYNFPSYNYDEAYTDEYYSIHCFCNNLWQHFVIDALPMLWFGRDILIDNPQIKVMMIYKNKSVIDYIWKKFELKNEIVFVPDELDAPKHYPAKNTYILDTNFDVPCHWWNQFVYKGVNDLFIKDEETSGENIIYCKRNHTRSVSNEIELIFTLKNVADILGKNFIIFESENRSFEDNVKLFNNAYAVIAPHGGANYNVIFSPPGTKFFEFTFIDQMNSLFLISAGIGLDYYMIPIRGTTASTGKFHVEEKYILEIANKLLAVNYR
jgi:hypothetical protein